MKVFYFNLVTSILLIVGGFFVPPIGEIDGSVLTAVGLLLMYGVLAQVPKILETVRDGKSIKLQKGDFSVDVTADSLPRHDGDSDSHQLPDPLP